MDLAIPYIHINRINIHAQEFNITYHKDQSNFGKLISFIQMNKNKKVNIFLPEGIEFEELLTLTNLSDNIYFVFDSFTQEDNEQLIKNNIKFYLSYTNPAANWKQLFYMVENVKVSQIYIADDLIYTLPQVKKYLENHNVKLRLVLNKIPETTPDKGNSFITPIFRPEDYSILEE